MNKTIMIEQDGLKVTMRAPSVADRLEASQAGEGKVFEVAMIARLTGQKNDDVLTWRSNFFNLCMKKFSGLLGELPKSYKSPSEMREPLVADEVAAEEGGGGNYTVEARLLSNLMEIDYEEFLKLPLSVYVLYQKEWEQRSFLGLTEKP